MLRCPRAWTRGGLFALMCVYGFASHAQAGFITYGGEVELSGSGYGNVLSVLALQGSPTEQGSVLRNASGTADVLSGDIAGGADPKTTTRTVQELIEQGVSGSFNNLSVVLRVNEAGPAFSLSMTGFTLRFYTNPDASNFFDVAWDEGPQTFAGTGVGTARHVFNVVLTDSERGAFFSNPANRLGMIVVPAIAGSGAGPDSFYVAHDERGSPLTAMPAPPSVILLGIGLAVLTLFRRGRAT